MSAQLPCRQSTSSLRGGLETRCRACGTSQPRFPSGIQAPRMERLGAERSQTLATGGKVLRPEAGSNKPKPLPSMVRRGSTVRVRQRASLHPCSAVLSSSAEAKRRGAASTERPRPAADDAARERETACLTSLPDRITGREISRRPPLRSRDVLSDTSSVTSTLDRAEAPEPVPAARRLQDRAGPRVDPRAAREHVRLARHR